MLCCNVILAHFAGTKEDLDSDTEGIRTCAARHLCQMSVLRYRQLEGFSDALPIGTVTPGVDRTLTTESLAVFIPFGTREMIHGGGICYGVNRKSGSAIVIDRGRLLNGNSFILGVSGSGKSFMAKNEIAALVLGGNADVIVIDPEREYVPLVKALSGEVIEISSSGKSHINAMDINRSYGDGGDPIAMKSEFLLSLCEQFAGNMSLGPKEKSVIDRCARNVYRTGGSSGIYTPPTLREFREELLRQDEPEAAEVALAIELFTDGSLSVFAQKTNVDTENRFLCYDISGLGEQLKSAGMLVILDSIFNRITANRAAGKKTYIFIDEIYLLFGHEYSAVFLETLWKRVRKYGAFCTGITQNVDDLLQSVTARTMLANSELVTMLDQAPTDRMQLAELMNISQTELPYITNVKAGNGLLKVGESLLPFECSFPTDNALYRLMTTKSGETA